MERKPVIMLAGKSKFQKDKDAREAKLKQEAEAAAAVYQDFVTTFVEQKPAEKTGTVFVRGGVIQKGENPGGAVPDANPKDKEYRMGGGQAPRSLAVASAFADDDDPASAPASRSKAAQLQVAAFSAAISNDGRRVGREMDALLEELKAKQDSSAAASAADPSRRDAGHRRRDGYRDGGGGEGGGKRSFGGDPDPSTTNVYVGNLAPSVTEEALGEAFGAHGRVVSVKIMWPRTEEERARGRNTGFVMFLTRADAEAGLAGMAERELEGCRVHLHWAKAVRLPAAAAAAAAALPFPVPPQRQRADGGPEDVPAAPGMAAAELSAVLAKVQATLGARSGEGAKAAAAPGSPALRPAPAPGDAPRLAEAGQQQLLLHHHADATGAAARAALQAAPSATAAAGGPTAAAGGPTAAAGGPSTAAGAGVEAVAAPPGLPRPSFPAFLPRVYVVPPGYRRVLREVEEAAKEGEGEEGAFKLEPCRPRNQDAAGEEAERAPSASSSATSSCLDVHGVFTRRAIDAWCEYLVKDGQGLEALLMTRENAALASSGGDAAERGGGGEGEAGEGGRLLPWLFAPDGSEAAVYYRWRVYSLLQGDSTARWRSAPFQMAASGSVWVPPPCPLPGAQEEAAALAGAEAELAARGRRDEEAASQRSSSSSQGPYAWQQGAGAGGHPGKRGRRERDGEGAGEGEEGGGRKRRRRGDSADRSGGGRQSGSCLEACDAQAWRGLLRRLSLSRPSIAEACAFALDRAPCAEEVVALLLEEMQGGAGEGTEGAGAERSHGSSAALPPPSCAAPLQVARLYLASDLLHNSAAASVRGASAYRSALQRALPDMCEAAAAARRRLRGRMTAAAMRARLGRLLAFWEAISVFPPPFLAGLEATLLRQEAQALEDWGHLRALHLPGCEEEEGAQAGGSGGDGSGGGGGGVAEEVARLCRVGGLSTAGGTLACLARLAWSHYYATQLKGEGVDPQEVAARAAAAAEASAAAPAALPRSLRDIITARDTGDWDAAGGAGRQRPFILTAPPAVAAAGIGQRPTHASMRSTHQQVLAAAAGGGQAALASPRPHPPPAGAAAGTPSERPRRPHPSSSGWRDAAADEGSGEERGGDSDSDVDGAPLDDDAAAQLARGRDDSTAPHLLPHYSRAGDDGGGEDDEDVDGVPL